MRGLVREFLAVARSEDVTHEKGFRSLQSALILHEFLQLSRQIGLKEILETYSDFAIWKPVRASLVHLLTPSPAFARSRPNTKTAFLLSAGANLEMLNGRVDDQA